MDREAAIHFRDQLRAARAVALRDAEKYEEIVLTVERLGAYLLGEIKNLGQYKDDIARLAEYSLMASQVPSELPDLHAKFERKYEIVRKARNAAVHEGAFARHLTVNAVELSLVLEEALMYGYNRVGDFMVANPACAFMWQPLSFVRQTMLANSFSYLPVPIPGDPAPTWRLVSDSELARYLRVDGEISKERLIRKLHEAVEAGGLKLLIAATCAPQDLLDPVLQRSQGFPTLVLSPDGEQLLGILTPFDFL